MKPILVTGYVNPDLDGLAGAVAYAEFLNKAGRQAEAAIFGAPHEEAQYVIDRFKLTHPKQIADADDYAEVILTDASDLNGLEDKVAPEKVIEIIDHRKINEAEKFPRAKTQIELVGAAATLIAEKFKEAGIPISKESATLIYSAIVSNTLNFKGSVTTERDRGIARWLRQFITIPIDYHKDLFAAKSDLTGPKLAQRIEGDFAWFVLGGKRVGIAQLEIIGAEKLIAERSQEIALALDKLKADLELDLIFLNIIELEKLKNFIIAFDKSVQELLVRILSIRFTDAVAVRGELIMRKQIVPLLTKVLKG